jgi:chlorite dismutase
MNKQKQSLDCEVTIKNYKEKYPLLSLNDLCPYCISQNNECYFINHMKEIKYFNAYPFNKKKDQLYLYDNDNVTNIFYLVDDTS